VSDILEDAPLNEPDEVSRANELAMRDTAEHISRVRAAVQPERVPDGHGGFIYQRADADGNYPFPDCVDCEDPIPSVRLGMGRIRCVGCQTRKERK
jgi:hypothetical protein